MSAILVRDGQGSDYYEQGLNGASITVSTTSPASDGATGQLAIFTVTAGNRFALSLELSTGLVPGAYQTARIPGDAPVVLDLGPGGCSDSGPGTVTVLAASYTDTGMPTQLAASFDLAGCGGVPARHGELRWNSTAALGALVAPDSTALSAPVMVNSTADLPVQLTARGNAPVTAGAAVLHQHPMSDGRNIWSIAHDGCAGHVLSPGQSCTVVVRLAPVRPDGYPEGIEDAWLNVPDGHSMPTWAPFTGKVVTLPGQPLGLTVEGAFRHLVLRWQRPDGTMPLNNVYRIYRIDSAGARQLVGTSLDTTFVVAGVPDRYSATYTVTSQGIWMPDGPLAVPASGTTASRELLYVTSAGPFGQQYAPSTATAQNFAFTGKPLTAWLGGGNLAVSRNQSTVAWSVTSPSLSYIESGAVDGASHGFSTEPGSTVLPQWDVDPAVSPDGSRIVYTHSTASDDQATVLRIAARTAGATPADVPGSAGLTDAVFDASGAGLVAVRHTGPNTELVHLNLTSGSLTPIANSAGLTEPDVSASGRIIAVASTDSAHPAASQLVSIASPGAAATPFAGTGTGANWHPQFSRDGATVYYLHRDDVLVDNDHLAGHGAQLSVATGLSGPLGSSQDTAMNSPYLLTEDGQHRVDSTAPTVRVLSPSGPAVTLGSLATAHWTGLDPVLAGAVTNGLASYDARYRVAGPNGVRSGYAYPPAWQHTINGVGSVPATAGISYCFSARGRDRAGNVSAWTPDSCLSSPLDDRGFVSSAAKSPANPAYYRATYSLAAKTGLGFSRSGVTATRLGVLVQTCPTCGSLDVWIGSHYAGRVRAYAPTTHYQQLVWLIVPRSSGTLVLRSTSAAPVRLDGVAVVN